MGQILETGRTWQCEPASECILGRIVAEDSNPVLARQAARVEARFAVSRALARTIAEHAFARGAQR